MKALLASTAFAVVAGVAAAQTAVGGGFVTTADPTDIRGSELIGATVYAADYEGDAETSFRADQAGFASIGAIDDLLLTRDGDVRAVLVDVGGFLGIGAKTVAVDASALQFVTATDGSDDWRVVIDGSRESLEAAPEFAPTPASRAALEPAQGERAAAAPMMDLDGWMRAEPAALTAENLEGVEVYDARNEAIGAIADFVMTEQGQIRSAVIDVGGFLGLGAHRVAVPFEEVSVMRDEDGDTFRAYVDLTAERLREMPTFEG